MPRLRLRRPLLLLLRNSSPPCDIYIHAWLDGTEERQWLTLEALSMSVPKVLPLLLFVLLGLERLPNWRAHVRSIATNLSISAGFCWFCGNFRQQVTGHAALILCMQRLPVVPFRQSQTTGRLVPPATPELSPPNLRNAGCRYC